MTASRVLHANLYGPDDPAAPRVLALHGLTGHGRRWERLAADHLPGVRVVAPDLLGHGFSTWEPPWSVADHVEAISQTLDEHLPEPHRPIVVVAHSFGGHLALALADARPDAVAGLVLLDPAQGLAPAFAREVAEASLAHWGYPSPTAAAAAKRMEGWGEVPAEILDDELDQHLIPWGDGGVAWRVSAPAAATAWSEMTRTHLLPPAGVPTHVVVADRVDPAFVRPEFLTDCARERADSVRVHRVDTEHMVPYLAPATVGELVRDLLDRVG